MKPNKLTLLTGVALILISFPVGIVLQNLIYAETFRSIKSDLIEHKEIKTNTLQEEKLKTVILSLDAGILFSAKTISKLIAIFTIVIFFIVGIFLILIWRIKNRKLQKLPH